MAQTGYSQLLIYSSSTASNTPSASNLTNSTTGSELAINIADGKLFYKDSGGSVQTIGWKTTPTSAGGTGLTTYTAGDLPYYASGTALSKLGIGASGTFLTSSGTAPQWSSASSVAVTSLSFGSTGLTPSTATQGAITVAGTLAAANGGTGQSSYTVGDILYASTTTALSKLSDVATGNALISGGTSTAPSWGKIGLTTHVSGTLPVANGGTNASSAGITAFNNITGYTASGATGTTSTNLVFSTSPTITTPTISGSASLSGGTYINSSTAGTYSFDVQGTQVSMLNNATVDFASFSGVIVVNNFNTGSNTMWIVGGGAVQQVATVGTPQGTMTFVSGIAGYRFTNTSGSTYVFSFFSLRTRSNS